MSTVVRELWPLLIVVDLPRALEFYRDKLGFRVVDQAEADGRVFWCRLKLGDTALMLQQEVVDEDGPAAGRGRGVMLYFVCDDVDGMYADLAERGVDTSPPTTTYYGMRQVELIDVDGYSLCFESRIDA